MATDVEIRVVVPAIEPSPGRIAPDLSGLPEGIEAGSSTYNPDGTFTITLSGDPSAVASVGALRKTDPDSYFLRMAFRVLFDLHNEMCRRTGNDDLIRLESDLLGPGDSPGLFQQALAAGLGDPGPRPDVE